MEFLFIFSLANQIYIYIYICCQGAIVRILHSQYREIIQEKESHPLSGKARAHGHDPFLVRQ